MFFRLECARSFVLGKISSTLSEVCKFKFSRQAITETDYLTRAIELRESKPQKMMQVEKRVHQIETPDNILWYTETYTGTHNATAELKPEYVVLIPSGEGDCQNHTTVAQLLASSDTGSYTVLTLDMPGMSRTSAPPEAYASVTPKLLAKQIIGLLEKLNIQRATLFGSSSGGSAALCITGSRPDLVKCAIVHELPITDAGPMDDMLKLSDDEISGICRNLFSNVFIEQDINDGRQKWEAIGPEYHARLAKNYVTWVRHFSPDARRWTEDIQELSREQLTQRPIFWTVGGLNPAFMLQDEKQMWAKNIHVAKSAGLVVNCKRLMCLHFPHVTIPNDLADWILECTGSVKD